MIAAALSLVLPGAGQLYAGRRARGLALLLGLPLQALLFRAVGMPGLVIWLAPAWLWSVADAHALARGRALSPALPALLLVALNLAAGVVITEVRPGELARGLSKMAPIVRGLLRPDLFERRRETQQATAPIRFVAPSKERLAPPRHGDTEKGMETRSAEETSVSDLRATVSPCFITAPAVAAGRETIQARGGGFWPGERGRVQLVASGIEVLAPVRVAADGTVAATVTLPERPPGRYWIDVVVERPLPGWQPTETLRTSARGVLDTIYLALMGTALAIPPSLLLAFCGARNLTRDARRQTPDASGSIWRLASGVWRLPWLYGAARGTMNLLRSVEVLIIALMFVVAVGPGPFAGVLALAIHGIGALGKLYSEAIESIDPGPIEAITATGARPAQVVAFGVVPQVVPQFVAFTIYRWDINVRSATVIGLVGGGGIGFMLKDSIDLLRWPQAATAIWLIALAVIVMDYASALVRERLA
jgi:phosphonate transport system permease protein